jgi:CubicO group peptidase (beta-lactamase class C family)
VSDESGVFGEIVRRGLEAGLFAGAVLRVERGRPPGGNLGADGAGRAGERGDLLFEEAWGQALCAGSERESMRTSTLFDLASVTKLFTATAVLRLVTLGELRLDAKAADILASGGGLRGDADGAIFERLRAGLGTIDVAALLAHSSGIHYWYPFYVRHEDCFEAILADVLEAHPPRGETIYSDLNFMILGRLIEGVTRAGLAEAVGALVLGPLGLSRTSFAKPLGSAAATEFGNRIERKMVADLGLAFADWRDESRPIRGEPDDGNCHYYFGGAAGHAGLFSDARDLCRLGRLYLDEGRIDAAEYLAPGLAEEALRDRGSGRGLGFQTGENYPGGGSGHTGFSGTYLHVNRPAGLVVAILANRLHVALPRDINPFRRELSEAALGRFK